MQYRLEVKIISRAKRQSAVGAAAYRSTSKLASVVAAAAYRSCSRMTALGADQDGMLTEMVFDYRAKVGLVRSEIHAPPDAPEWVHDRQELWRQVEAQERYKNAQLAREILITLPRDLPIKAAMGAMRKFLQDNVVGVGMVADVSVHAYGSPLDPLKLRQAQKLADIVDPAWPIYDVATMSGSMEALYDHPHVLRSPDGLMRVYQPHAHVLTTMRRLTPTGFAATKERDWNRKELALQWRADWALKFNQLLAECGRTERVSAKAGWKRELDAIRDAGDTAEEERLRQSRSPRIADVGGGYHAYLDDRPPVSPSESNEPDPMTFNQQLIDMRLADEAKRKAMDDQTLTLHLEMEDNRRKLAEEARLRIEQIEADVKAEADQQVELVRAAAERVQAENETLQRQVHSLSDESEIQENELRKWSGVASALRNREPISPAAWQGTPQQEMIIHVADLRVRAAKGDRASGLLQRLVKGVDRIIAFATKAWPAVGDTLRAQWEQLLMNLHIQRATTPQDGEEGGSVLPNVPGPTTQASATDIPVPQTGQRDSGPEPVAIGQYALRLPDSYTDQQMATLLAKLRSVTPSELQQHQLDTQRAAESGHDDAKAYRSVLAIINRISKERGLVAPPQSAAVEATTAISRPSPPKPAETKPEIATPNTPPKIPAPAQIPKAPPKTGISPPSL